MAQYKAIKLGFCGVKLREPGEIFPYEGEPGSWMELVATEEKSSVVTKPNKKTASAQAPKPEPRNTGDADVI